MNSTIYQLLVNADNHTRIISRGIKEEYLYRSHYFLSPTGELYCDSVSYM